MGLGRIITVRNGASNLVISCKDGLSLNFSQLFSLHSDEY
jgi:hypothetical protein